MLLVFVGVDYSLDHMFICTSVYTTHNTRFQMYARYSLQLEAEKRARACIKGNTFTFSVHFESAFKSNHLHMCIYTLYNEFSLLVSHIYIYFFLQIFYS